MPEFKCNECGKEFGSAEALSQHGNSKHPKSESRPVITKGGAKRAMIIAVIALVMVGLGLYFYFSMSYVPQNLGAVGSQHIHADFKLYINGNAVGLSQQKYQLRSKYVHMENGDGDIVHVHATGVTLDYFLRTIGFGIDKNCLATDASGKLCPNGSESLAVYVNGGKRGDAANYVFRNLDKILVSYGSNSEAEIASEIASITDKAQLQPKAG
ncbi:MAG: hypothetical protein WC602_01260 [archaeon]